METEEKGFTVRDRRSFDEEGDLKEEKEETAEARDPEPQAKEEKQKQTGSEHDHPLPEVKFN